MTLSCGPRSTVSPQGFVSHKLCFFFQRCLIFVSHVHLAIIITTRASLATTLVLTRERSVCNLRNCAGPGECPQTFLDHSITINRLRLTQNMGSSLLRDFLFLIQSPYLLLVCLDFLFLHGKLYVFRNLLISSRLSILLLCHFS